MNFLRFFAFNLLGNVLPFVVAIVSFPIISRYGGLDRMGILGVVWSILGYFGFLDFGLSRVVTRRVALAVAQARLSEELTLLRGFALWWGIPGLVVLSCVLYGLKFVLHGLFPSGTLGQELYASWFWLVLCVPITLVTNWLRGALEGVERFARVNLLRTVFGAWNYAGPAIAALVLPGLEAMIISLVLGRLLAMLGHFYACVQSEPHLVLGPAPRMKVRELGLMKEAGWISVSNLIGPLMMYSDRLVLAALLAPSAVAVYASIQEVVSRASVIPAALAGALFPKFSGMGEVDPKAAPLPLYLRSIRVISTIMLPLCVVMTAGSYDALTLWLGADFAGQGYRVVEVLAVGIFLNAIAFLPFAWLQGSGRAKLIAFAHLLQFPLYCVALTLATRHYGVIGAAWVWTSRLGIDCILLLILATRKKLLDILVVGIGGALVLTLLGLLIGPATVFMYRLAAALGAGLLSVLVAWFLILNKDDRKELVSLHSL